MLAHIRSRSAASVWHRQLRPRLITTTVASSSSSHPIPQVHGDYLPPSEQVIDYMGVYETRESHTNDDENGTHADPKRARYSVFVRPWTELTSMPQVFAIVHAIERQYGPVRGITLHRDYEAPQLYLSYFVVDLADRAAWERIPASRTNLKIKKPAFDVRRPGGPGLDDLAPFLEQGTAYPQQPDLSIDSHDVGLKDDDADTFHVKLERAKKPPHVEANIRPRVSLRVVNGTIQEFIKWGGFHIPAPGEPESATRWMREARKSWMKKGLSNDEGAAAEKEYLAQELGTTEQPSSSSPPRSPEEEAEDLKPFMYAELAGFRAARADAAAASAATLEASSSHQAVSSSAATSGDAPSAAVAAPSPTGWQDIMAEVKNISAPEAKQPLTKRERLLAQARANARTPLPPKYTQNVEERQREEEERRAEEAERAQQERQLKTSLQERLRKLIGGGWS